MVTQTHPGSTLHSATTTMEPMTMSKKTITQDDIEAVRKSLIPKK
jgi:hypothetical protein